MPLDITERCRRDEFAHTYDAALHWAVNKIPTVYPMSSRVAIIKLEDRRLTFGKPLSRITGKEKTTTRATYYY